MVLSTIAVDEALRHSSQVKLNEALKVNGQELLNDYIHSWLSDFNHYVSLGVGNRHSDVKRKRAAIERLADLETITAA
jgi:hypothetical protein